MPDFDPKVPYNELPELPPPLEVIESTEILKDCIKARVALAELKQAADLIPNSAVLVNALPLLEARASSEIENIVTTTDKLFEFADIAEDKADAATKEPRRKSAQGGSRVLLFAAAAIGDLCSVEGSKCPSMHRRN